MPDAQVTQLIKMANQIVNNNLHDDKVVDITVNHLKRFWALSMKHLIIEYAKSDGTELEPAAKKAVAILAENYGSCGT